MKRRIIISSIITLLIDILTKFGIERYFELSESKIIIPNFFSLTKVYNYGVSFSMLNNERYIIILITLIVFAMLITYAKKFKNNFRNSLMFGLLFGGIIGNLINRIFLGYVIDFLDFKIFGYNYPVFNIADIGIVFGVILMIYAIIKKEDVNESSSR